MSHTTAPVPFSIDPRWCPANDEGTRFFVGDSYGRLALLSLDSTAERALLIIPLGEVRDHVATSSGFIPKLSLLGFSSHRSSLYRFASFVHWFSSRRQPSRQDTYITHL